MLCYAPVTSFEMVNGLVTPLPPFKIFCGRVMPRCAGRCCWYLLALGNSGGEQQRRDGGGGGGYVVGTVIRKHAPLCWVRLMSSAYVCDGCVCVCLLWARTPEIKSCHLNHSNFLPSIRDSPNCGGGCNKVIIRNNRVYWELLAQNRQSPFLRGAK